MVAVGLAAYSVWGFVRAVYDPLLRGSLAVALGRFGMFLLVQPFGRVLLGVIEVTTRPRVRVYADNARVGLTPATITAELSAVQVLLRR